MEKRPDELGSFGAAILVLVVIVVGVLLIGYLNGCTMVVVQQGSPGASGIDPTVGTEISGVKPKEVGKDAKPIKGGPKGNKWGG